MLLYTSLIRSVYKWFILSTIRRSLYRRRSPSIEYLLTYSRFALRSEFKGKRVFCALVLRKAYKQRACRLSEVLLALKT
ncbi:hypothetical protein PZA11_005953 [Diplocarpon coronariae]